MKLSKNFRLEEFVPQGIWANFGKSSIWFIDKRIVDIAQFFRDRYGHEITINDWAFGGHRTGSGLRYWDTAVGAQMSQHKFGRAIDMKWLTYDMNMDVVREDIRQNEAEFMACGLTTVEEGTDTWLHADCRWTGLSQIKFIPLY